METDNKNWHQAIVRSIRDITSDIRLFEFEVMSDFVPADPGSHIDVQTIIDGNNVTRSYSTIGPGADGVYQIAVRLQPESRGGSEFLWNLKPDARLKVKKPANNFELSANCPQFALVAGGIGITPIYSMAMALAARKAEFNVYYGCRTTDDIAFGDELKSLLGERLRIFVSERGERIDLTGVIESLRPDGEMYVCGPITMLDEARSLWSLHSRQPERLRIETFANSGHFPNEDFKVHLLIPERTIEVSKNQTILEALEAAGIESMYDCRRGECGLCALTVVDTDGVIDHRDVFFSETEKKEGRKLCACVSRIIGGSIIVDTGQR